jgi:hypothetical protein
MTIAVILAEQLQLFDGRIQGLFVATPVAIDALERFRSDSGCERHVPVGSGTVHETGDSLCGQAQYGRFTLFDDLQHRRVAGHLATDELLKVALRPPIGMKPIDNLIDAPWSQGGGQVFCGTQPMPQGVSRRRTGRRVGSMLRRARNAGGMKVCIHACALGFMPNALPA